MKKFSLICLLFAAPLSAAEQQSSALAMKQEQSAAPVEPVVRKDMLFYTTYTNTQGNVCTTVDRLVIYVVHQLSVSRHYSYRGKEITTSPTDSQSRTRDLTTEEAENAFASLEQRSAVQREAWLNFAREIRAAINKSNE